MKKSEFSLSKLIWVSSFFVFALVLQLFMGCSQGPPPNSRQAQAMRGKVLFNKHCAVCHGNNGDGPMAETLKVAPPDLTKIMKRRKTGEFPILTVAKFIDGREVVKGHGTREMPIWGDVFAGEEQLTEAEIKGKMGELIAYLMTIQVQ